MKKQLLADYYDEWVDTYKAGSVKDVTLQKYKMTAKSLRKLRPALSITELNRREYQKILNEYAETHEKATVTDFHHQLKACVMDMFYDGVIEKDPTYKAVVKGMPPKGRKKKFLQIDELKKLLQTLDMASGINMDWMILLLAKTGIRYAEVLGVTPADFDWEKRTLSINKTWNYKTAEGGFRKTKTSGSVRTIAIDQHIVGQFKPITKKLSPGEPIFIQKNKDDTYKRVFNSTLVNLLKRKCEQAGVPVISPHSLRHTHASILLAEGITIHTISERLGHANVTVTQEIYTHILDSLHQKDNEKMMEILKRIA